MNIFSFHQKKDISRRIFIKNPEHTFVKIRSDAEFMQES